MIFETERIFCRDLNEDDFADIHSYASRDDVVKYMAWGPNTEEETQYFLEESLESISYKPRTRFELAIIDKHSNQFIGVIALFITSPENRVGEIGYGIKPEFWQLGYASEAAIAAVKYGINILHLHRLEATCDVRNVGSARVLEKAGFIREGEIREHILLRDGWRDSYLYGILESD